jgi:hypothetical protein
MIFNVVIDCIIRKWKGDSSGPQIRLDHRLVEARFYADDGMLSSVDPVVLQTALDILRE